MRSRTRKSSENEQNTRHQPAAADPHQLATVAAGLGLALVTTAVNAEQDRLQAAQATTNEAAQDTPDRRDAVNNGFADNDGTAQPHFAQANDTDGASTAEPSSFATSPVANHFEQRSEVGELRDIASADSGSRASEGVPATQEPPQVSSEIGEIGMDTLAAQPVMLHTFDLSQLQLGPASFSANNFMPSLSEATSAIAQASETITQSLNSALDSMTGTASGMLSEVIPTHLAGEAFASLAPGPMTLGFLGQPYAESIDLHDVSSALNTPLHGLI